MSRSRRNQADHRTCRHYVFERKSGEKRLQRKSNAAGTVADVLADLPDQREIKALSALLQADFDEKMTQLAAQETGEV